MESHGSKISEVHFRCYGEIHEELELANQSPQIKQIEHFRGSNGNQVKNVHLLGTVGVCFAHPQHHALS